MNTESARILAHIKENGFGGFKIGAARPSLSPSLSPEDFRLNYYYKTELAEFCRAEGIPTAGSKSEMNSRIETYLLTGKIAKLFAAVKTGEPDSRNGLSLDKPVVNYKSDPATREFFKKHIPEFKGFSAFVQKDLKRRLSEGEKLQYRDLIVMHKQFLNSKHNQSSPIRVAQDSCQLNQFQIDYKNEHDNTIKVHSLKDAWRLIRNSPGEKTFKRYKETIQAIREDINKSESK